MSSLAVTLERNLDVVRETLRVAPARPMNLSEQASGARFRSGDADVGTRGIGLGVEELVDEWLGNALQVAAQAALLAEENSDSPAAWTRSAFAQLVAGRRDEARTHARRAIVEARRNAVRVRTVDVPAIAGAVRVLSGLGEMADMASALEGLPDDPQLLGLRASLVADSGDLDLALHLLEGASAEESSSLAGYLWLRKNELPKAIRSLRLATTRNVKDVDAHFNLALALNRIGSPKKALRSVGVAQRLSPGRLDVEHLYLELLAGTGNWELLKREIGRLRSRGVHERPEVLIAETRLALLAEKRERALILLKRAEKLADERGDKQLVAELQGNQVMVRFASNKLDRKTAKKELLFALESVPDSVVLADMLSMLIVRRSEARLLEKFAAQHAKSQSPFAFSLRTRTAYLTGRFDDCLMEVREWLKIHPNDNEGLMSLMSIVGHLDDDWSRAAEVARHALRKLPMTALLANQAAYSLAVAGQSQAADAVLDRSPGWNYRLEATRGLVKICLGDMALGLKHYRMAAKMVDLVPDVEDDALLMTIHQGMALRRLGLINPSNDKLLRAAALPVMSLPDDWEDISSFVALKSAADRNGWTWPVLLD